MDNKLLILSKTFENKKVRTIWNKDEEKYYISVVDIVEVITECDRSRKYWNDLKRKLIDEGYEVSE